MEQGNGPLLLYDEARRAVRLTLCLSPQFRDRHHKVVYILQTLAFSPEAVEAGSLWALQVSEQPTTKGAIVVLRKDKDIVPLKGNACDDVESRLCLMAQVHALSKLKF